MPDRLKEKFAIAARSKKDMQAEIDDHTRLLVALENFVKKQGRVLYISDQETDLAPLVGALRCEILTLEKDAE